MQFQIRSLSSELMLVRKAFSIFGFFKLDYEFFLVVMIYPQEISLCEKLTSFLFQIIGASITYLLIVIQLSLSRETIEALLNSNTNITNSSNNLFQTTEYATKDTL